MEFKLQDFLNDLEQEKVAEIAEQGENEKQASDAAAEGKIMAEAFMERLAELDKVAVGDAPITPDTAAIKLQKNLTL
jgi:hypothetical protein